MNGISFACTDLNNCVVDLVAGDNSFTFWANSSYGDGSQMGTVTAKVDAVKPDIVPSISGTMGENGWFVTDVTATFRASDPAPGSGLNTFETSLDNTSWAPYVSPLVFTEGQHHLYVKATDFAANVHSLNDEIKVDTTPPTISGTISGTLGGANWYVTAPQASVTVADTMSGIASVEYNVDSSGWQPYSTAVTFDDGPHTIQFRTYDAAGWSAETETFSFQVDTTGPSIKLPSRWYIWESADFVVKDDQSKVVSVSYAIRDGQNRWKKVERNWTPNTHEFSRTISWNRVFADGITAPIGSYPVRVYAEDAAGNVSWKDAEIVIPGVNDPPLPTFTPTPTAEPTEEVVVPSVDATATPTPIPPVSEEDDDEETAPFVFGGNTPDDSSGTEPAAPAPSSSVLWGAAAAAAIGTYQATMSEKKRRGEEAARARRNSESAQRRLAEKEGRLDEYIRDKRKAKEAAAKAKEARIRQKDEDRRADKKREQSGLTGKEWKAKEAQQAIWDANGAAIYKANQKFKEEYGTEMDAEIREKAIAAATIEGVFNIDEYKGMLNTAEQIKQQMSGAGSGQGALYSPVPQSGNGDDLDSATRHYIAMAEAIMADPSLYERMTGKPIPPHLYGQLGISVPSPTSTPIPTEICFPPTPIANLDEYFASLPEPYAQYPKDMTISERGINFIMTWENFEPQMYNDGENEDSSLRYDRTGKGSGHCTIGYGQLVHHGPCDKGTYGSVEKPFAGGISEEEAYDLLVNVNMPVVERYIQEYVEVKLTQSQYDALASLIYNWNGDRFVASETKLPLLNSGQYEATAQDFLRGPITSGGVKLDSMVRRRTQEAEMFLELVDTSDTEISCSPQPEQ